MEVITGGGERRRRWSDEEKAQAVEESLAPGAVVSAAVARPRGLTPQQLFSWRREARRRAAEPDAVPFAPVVVERREKTPVALETENKPIATRPHVIELDINGVSLWIWRAAPVGMVTTIIDAFKARS
nr:transposase [Methylocystis iwaonis]